MKSPKDPNGNRIHVLRAGSAMPQPTECYNVENIIQKKTILKIISLTFISNCLI